MIITRKDLGSWIKFLRRDHEPIPTLRNVLALALFIASIKKKKKKRKEKRREKKSGTKREYNTSD